MRSNPKERDSLNIHRARGTADSNGKLTLTDALFQEAYVCASVGSTSPGYNSKPEDSNFHAELVPVHSPLLGESCLVSRPPLTYMLKFSGFADLTSCLLVLIRFTHSLTIARHRRDTATESKTHAQQRVYDGANHIWMCQGTRTWRTSITSSTPHQNGGRAKLKVRT